MMKRPHLIALDADDTLWHTEKLYQEMQQSFNQLLSAYHDPSYIEKIVEEIEIPNLKFYGYGISGYILSLIEAAIELSNGQIDAHVIQSLINMGKEASTAEVQLFDHVEETLRALSTYPLILITKGDLLQQENKIKRSGLRKHFQCIEIVSDKTAETYCEILNKYHIDAGHFMMVGDSLRSDILPVIECGGQAVHIPSRYAWNHENSVPAGQLQDRYIRLEHIGKLPEFLASLAE